MQNEIEIKFFINTKDEIRKKLTEIGLSLYKTDFLMKRKCYGEKDYPKYFRVRQEHNKIVMTCKHITGKEINSVLETEIEINDFDKGCEILSQTGLPLKSYQETYREIWKNEEIEVMIDEWPYLQPFIEIEGKNEEIVKKYTKLLNFNFDKGFFGAVDVLYNKQYGIDKNIINNIPVFTFNNKELENILNKKESI